MNQVICWTGVGPGVSYKGEKGYVRPVNEFGSYFDPVSGAAIIRDNVQNHPSDSSRTAPITRKTSQQLQYLALNSQYSVENTYNQFAFTEVRSLNMRNGQIIVQVFLTSM